MYYTELCIQIDNIDRKHQAERMYAARGHYPKALIRPQAHLAKQSTQPRQRAACHLNPEVDKRLAGYIECIAGNIPATFVFFV